MLGSCKQSWDGPEDVRQQPMTASPVISASATAPTLNSAPLSVLLPFLSVGAWRMTAVARLSAAHHFFAAEVVDRMRRDAGTVQWYTIYYAHSGDSTNSDTTEISADTRAASHAQLRTPTPLAPSPENLLPHIPHSLS